MTRNLTEFNTDDPLLIELGKIYRAYIESAGDQADLVQDIQNAVAPYLSKPGNPAKGLPTNIGVEQTPEQKRINVRRAIAAVSPTISIVPGLEYEPDMDQTFTEDRWRGKVSDGFQDYAE